MRRGPKRQKGSHKAVVELERRKEQREAVLRLRTGRRVCCPWEASWGRRNKVGPRGRSMGWLLVRREIVLVEVVLRRAGLKLVVVFRMVARKTVVERRTAVVLRNRNYEGNLTFFPFKIF